jgi:hypothetical protein
MKSIFIIIFIIAVSNKFCTAQIGQLITGNSGTFDGVHTSDLLLLSQSEVTNLDNADISGNPFWDENWRTALLYTGKYAILVSKVKLNQYKNDVWYTTPDSLVMIAKKGQVKGITFFNGDDTTSILANFGYIKNGDDKNYRYYQFLNVGKIQLLKLNTVSVNKPPFDPFTGKSDLSYSTQTTYYIYYNTNITSLKGDNKEIIFSILNPGDSSKEWLTKNKNKLKSSSDIIRFLDYFNTQAGK